MKHLAKLRLLIPLFATVASSSLGAQQLAESLESQLRAKIEAGKIPGLSCAVACDGELVFSRGFGVADLENDVPATEATVYRLASISKPITAVLAMQLVEAGELDLDADVCGIVDHWPKKRWPVTTRQLLAHLGGVRHYRGEGESTRRYANQRKGLERFAKDRLLYQPGTKHTYSTYGFNLVAAVVESLHSKPFAKIVRERIAEPCQAPTLQDDDQRRLIKHRAQGYVRRGNQLHNSQLMDSSYKLGGGGLCASAPDLAKFASALMAGKLLKAETCEAMWTEQRTTGDKPVGYGLGFSLRKKQGQRVIQHGGAQSRVSTMLCMLPDDRIAVVIMCNLERQRFGKLAQELAFAVRAHKQGKGGDKE